MTVTNQAPSSWKNTLPAEGIAKIDKAVSSFRRALETEHSSPRLKLTSDLLQSIEEKLDELGSLLRNLSSVAEAKLHDVSVNTKYNPIEFQIDPQDQNFDMTSSQPNSEVLGVTSIPLFDQFTKDARELGRYELSRLARQLNWLSTVVSKSKLSVVRTFGTDGCVN